jgi:hypothetical protein
MEPMTMISFGMLLGGIGLFKAAGEIHFLKQVEKDEQEKRAYKRMVEEANTQKYYDRTRSKKKRKSKRKKARLRR